MVEVQSEKATVGSAVQPFVVVGVPAFNEEKTIARVVLEAQRRADLVVVCDDGSSDLTAEIAERMGANVVRHEQNRGYGAAIQSLFRRAVELGADVLVTLDADGQHDPSEVPNVVKPVVEGRADVVVGSRFLDQRLAYTMPWYRRAGVRFITKLTNGGSKKNSVLDAQSGFRAYSRDALESLVLFEDGMGVSSEILINARKQGLQVCEVASSCRYDNGGEVETSTQNPVRHGIDVVMSVVRIIVEEKPLTVLGIPGIVCLIGGALFGVWLLHIYATEHHIVTNIALASLAFTMIGFFALSTAITLYGIRRAISKIRK